MTTAEKVAYLKGLAEGLGIDKNEKEGKLLSTVIDILEDLALDLEDVMDSVDELAEGLDAVSDDLESVEEILYGDDFDDFDDDDDEEDEVFDADDLVLYEAQCPTCGEFVTFEESVLDQGGIACPNCGESLEFELEPDTGEEEGEDIPF